MVRQSKILKNCPVIILQLSTLFFDFYTRENIKMGLFVLDNFIKKVVHCTCKIALRFSLIPITP